jgi:hypothetical protein
MLKIISEVKSLNTMQKSNISNDDGQRSRSVSTLHKQNFTFDDLQKSMSEFGVSIKRPSFVSEKS